MKFQLSLFLALFLIAATMSMEKDYDTNDTIVMELYHSFYKHLIPRIAEDDFKYCYNNLKGYSYDDECAFYNACLAELNRLTENSPKVEFDDIYEAEAELSDIEQYKAMQKQRYANCMKTKLANANHENQPQDTEGQMTNQYVADLNDALNTEYIGTEAATDESLDASTEDTTPRDPLTDEDYSEMFNRFLEIQNRMKEFYPGQVIDVNENQFKGVVNEEFEKWNTDDKEAFKQSIYDLFPKVPSINDVQYQTTQLFDADERSLDIAERIITRMLNRFHYQIENYLLDQNIIKQYHSKIVEKSKRAIMENIPIYDISYDAVEEFEQNIRNMMTEDYVMTMIKKFAYTDDEETYDIITKWAEADKPKTLFQKVEEAADTKHK